MLLDEGKDIYAPAKHTGKWRQQPPGKSLVKIPPRPAAQLVRALSGRARAEGSICQGAHKKSTRACVSKWNNQLMSPHLSPASLLNQ